MICEASILSCIKIRINELNIIENNHILSSLLLEITVAESLANAYYETIHSIYWNQARAITRRRVKHTLNEILYKIKDHLIGEHPI